MVGWLAGHCSHVDAWWQMLLYALKIALLSAIIGFCLFGSAICYYAEFCSKLGHLLHYMQYPLTACFGAWCYRVCVLTYKRSDLLLIGLLLVAAGAYFVKCLRYSTEQPNVIILLAGVALGKESGFLLNKEANIKNEGDGRERRFFLHGLVFLLAFSAWWHLDMSRSFYAGLRWSGLWDDPNIYGMLMGAGTTLAIALQVLGLKFEVQSPKSVQRRKLTVFFLFVAITMMGVGLVMSYSRGAWLGTTVGLLYFAWNCGKLKWRYVLPGVAVVLVAVLFFWNHTADSAPWFIKRADLGRPSAQHRVAAWKAGFEIMRDHPFGVGWNNTVQVYQDHYCPPEDGAAAITTNDYLMIGTQLGIPALVCFVAYVALCFRSSRRSAAVAAAGCGGVSPPAETPGGTPGEPADVTSALRVACRSGAFSMLVAFWFDGGLFVLPTASVFWILLELGADRDGASKLVKSENYFPSHSYD